MWLTLDDCLLKIKPKITFRQVYFLKVHGVFFLIFLSCRLCLCSLFTVFSIDENEALQGEGRAHRIKDDRMESSRKGIRISHCAFAASIILCSTPTLSG